MKKIVFYTWSVFVALIVLEVVFEIVHFTLLQILPILAAWFLVYLDMFANKKLSNVIVVLSLIMFLINLASVSVIDMVLWGMTIVAYSKENNG